MNMKKSLLIVLFLLSISSYAKKLDYPIEVVAGMADLIVVGEIKSVHSDSYDFKINNTIKGQEQEAIKVHMFKEWKCDTRMKRPEAGQKLFLFLIKKISSYEIINGSTGEIFIEDNCIVRTIFNLKPTVEELSVAIRAFTSCYAYKGEYKPGEAHIFIQKKDDGSIQKLALTSPLTTGFFDKMKSYTIEYQL
jgi:hypothetical protein